MYKWSNIWQQTKIELINTLDHNSSASGSPHTRYVFVPRMAHFPKMAHLALLSLQSDICSVLPNMAHLVLLSLQSDLCSILPKVAQIASYVFHFWLNFWMDFLFYQIRFLPLLDENVVCLMWYSMACRFLLKWYFAKFG